MKKANKLQSLWIIIRSCFLTFRLSLMTLFYNYFGTPKQIDQLLENWSAKLLKIVKLSYHIHNPYQFNFQPNQAYVLMSNHSSLYDIPLIFVAFSGQGGRIRMIAKKELFKVPLWGKAMQKAEFIAIDRKNSAQAIHDLAIVKEKMRHGIVIWVAPEGTRSRHGKLNPFKKGAFMLALEIEAIIVPIGIRGAREVLPPKSLQFGLEQNVDIHIGQPVDTRNYSKQTRAELINEVKKRIAEAAALESV